MATKTAICNLALRSLGCESISSLSESSKSAEVLNDIYDDTRKRVLAEYPWHFALKRAILTAGVTVPAFEWGKSFTMPTDMLLPFYEYNEEEYAIEGTTILSDAGTLNMVYISDVKDEKMFHPLFTKVFYLELAIEASYSLTQDKELLSALNRELKETRSEARSLTSQAISPRQFKIDSFTDVRL